VSLSRVILPGENVKAREKPLYSLEDIIVFFLCVNEKIVISVTKSQFTVCDIHAAVCV
jgi:hypothetical protein